MNNNTLMFKEIMEQMDCINKCKNYNQQNVKEIASIIQNFKPQNIIIVGRGTSMHAGIYAKHLLELYYHVPVVLAAQSIFTIYDSYTDLSKSLVIGISQSGGGKDNFTVLKKANEKGALTLGIVNNLESIVAKEAKHILYCDAGEAKAPAATKTFTTTLYLITQLVYELTKNESLNINSNDIIEAMKSGLAQNQLIKEKTKGFVDAKSVLALGRGLALSLAMETSLKVKETSNINVSAYPISEFHHGTIASINKDIPIILFGLDKETQSDVQEVYGQLEKNNIPILLISNDKNFVKGENAILLQNVNPIYVYFEAVIIVQLFACELALAKGKDPDHYVSSDPAATF